MNVIRKVGVVVCALDPTGEWRVFLRKNSPFNGTNEEWNVTYGHIEAGEEADVCAERELREETGISGTTITSAGKNIARTFPDGKEISIEFFLAVRQDIPSQVSLNEESIGFQWVVRDEAIQLIVDPMQREAIEYCLRQVK